MFITFLFSCSRKTKVDLIITNGRVYTLDSAFSITEALAIKDGKIIATGSGQSITDHFSPGEVIDAKKKFIYPGFIDAHCHFLEYGRGLNECDLTGTESWQEVLTKLVAFASSHQEGWLIGRGWDQNDWTIKQFPVNDSLNKIFPSRPVLLTRVDGHAAIVNNMVLKAAGITEKTNIPGGQIIFKNNKPTGVLIDNAVGMAEQLIPAPGSVQISQWLLSAQKNCFKAGLTSVQDCGLDADQVLVIDSLNKANALLMRMYVMLSDKKENYQWAFSHGKIKNPLLHVGSFKLYADGALGSRGACLLRPYNDEPDHYGFLLNPIPYYDSILHVIATMGWQACTHAIGDSANRIILKLYKKHIRSGRDQRWRIEHAQVIDEKDFTLFRESGIIPSVQPTHATSDMYWANDRLGKQRIKGAYAYERLLQQNGWIALGTDFPVEDISPIKTFYAAVARKDAGGYPVNGFQKENALTREQALRGMTIWAAKAAFGEKEKGSIEKGKYADFIILDRDLMQVPESEILSTRVLLTVSGGKQVYKGNL